MRGSELLEVASPTLVGSLPFYVPTVAKTTLLALHMV